MSDQKPNRKKSVLGRGLGALLEDSPAKHKSEDILPEVVKTGIFEIPLDQIQVNPFHGSRNHSAYHRQKTRYG